MSDKILLPNVPNYYHNKPHNFKLTIYAFRKLNKEEIMSVAENFKAQCGWSVFPNNKEYKCHVMIE